MNSFGTRGTLAANGKTYTLYRLDNLSAHADAVKKLPWSMKILLENLLRKEDGRVVRKEHIESVLNWQPTKAPDEEISFYPARVLMQDFTGVPASPSRRSSTPTSSMSATPSATCFCAGARAPCRTSTSFRRRRASATR